MRSRTRKLLGFSAVLLVIAAIGLAVYLRKRAAPEPARLLPNSDVVFYVNLGTVRHLTSFGKNPVNPEEPEYILTEPWIGYRFNGVPEPE